MLDAFIIHQIKREKEREQEEWRPVPLTLELPLLKREEDDRRNHKKEEVLIKFCI